MSENPASSTVKDASVLSLPSRSFLSKAINSSFAAFLAEVDVPRTTNLFPSTSSTTSKFTSVVPSKLNGVVSGISFFNSSKASTASSKFVNAALFNPANSKRSPDTVLPLLSVNTYIVSLKSDASSSSIESILAISFLRIFTPGPLSAHSIKGSFSTTESNPSLVSFLSTSAAFNPANSSDLYTKVSSF